MAQTRLVSTALLLDPLAHPVLLCVSINLDNKDICTEVFVSSVRSRGTGMI